MATDVNVGVVFLMSLTMSPESLFFHNDNIGAKIKSNLKPRTKRKTVMLGPNDYMKLRKKRKDSAQHNNRAKRCDMKCLCNDYRP